VRQFCLPCTHNEVTNSQKAELTWLEQSVSKKWLVQVGAIR
jgi:hypothetical protein